MTVSGSLHAVIRVGAMAQPACASQVDEYGRPRMRSRWRMGALSSCLAFVLAACASGSSSGAGAPAKPAKPGRRRQRPPRPRLPARRLLRRETITWVNFSPGGPTDVFARLLARSLDQHAPGRPTIIVENKPGAGGMVGMNYVYNVSKRDGLTIGVFSRLPRRSSDRTACSTTKVSSPTSA